LAYKGGMKAIRSKTDLAINGALFAPAASLKA
jgi:hypothetical protein